MTLGGDNSPDPDLERWRSSTALLLGFVSQIFFQQFSISIVPEQLWEGNENAYMPKVVSMGARYKGRRELLPMEEIKLQCMLSRFCGTEDPERSLEKCMRVLLEMDAVVRSSYVEEIKLDRYELATIMLLDGCFLLELLISSHHELAEKLSTTCPCGHLEAQVGQMAGVLTDLTQLENQIPLFIPFMLFQIPFTQYHYEKDTVDKFINMAQILFGYCGSSNSSQNYYTAAHFLELVHLSSIEESGKLEAEENNQHISIVIGVDKLSKPMTREKGLLAAGIRIRSLRTEIINERMDILTSSIKINYSGAVLENPQLRITKRTETEWRNLIALEHNMKNRNNSAENPRCCKFTLLAILFNDLICCASDVQLLKDRDIIDSNYSNQDLVAFFRSITKGVNRGIIDSNYSKMFDYLNKYSATNQATRFSIMLWHSFTRIAEAIYGLHKFLRRGYNFAAAIITLLTVVQTIYTVLSYHFPK